MATKTISAEWSPGVQVRSEREETAEKLFPRMRNVGKMQVRAESTDFRQWPARLSA
jgi:hypothetical protein